MTASAKCILDTSVSAFKYFATGRKIAFLDPRADDLAALLAGVRPDVEAVVLDPRRPGLEQIDERVRQSGRREIREIHIVSHGEPGRFQLGADWVDAGILERYRLVLNRWRDFLASDAEILIYGCEVAATEAGVALVRAVRHLTGASAIASSTPVGRGNWTLDVASGNVQALPPFSAATCQSYGGRFDGQSNQLTFVEAISNDEIDGLDGAATVTLSPDGNFVYAASQNDDAIVTFSRDALTGELTFVEARSDSDSGIDGLDGAISVTASPDGKFVYAASFRDDAIATFARDEVTGKLTFVEAIFDGEEDGSGTTIDGLDGARSVAISPDENFLYAVSFEDSAIATFARDKDTGKLTFVEAVADGEKDSSDNDVDGLGGARSATVSPDGNFIYVASTADDAIATFERDKDTGKLTFVEAIFDDAVSGASQKAPGLDGAIAVTLSPDGNFVYTASFEDNAIATFQRDPGTGKLAFLEADINTENDGSGNTIAGLDEAFSVAASPDGNFVYAAGRGSHAIATFARDPIGGGLTFLGADTDDENDSFGNPIDGLRRVRSVAVSPDGNFIYTASVGEASVGEASAIAVFGAPIPPPAPPAPPAPSNGNFGGFEPGEPLEVHVPPLNVPPNNTSNTISLGEGFASAIDDADIVGANTSDRITLADRNNTVRALDGNDNAFGGSGNDFIQLNRGNDYALGRDGNDTIWGGKDDDYAEGNDGNDILEGHIGNDTLWGADGDDFIFGGLGNALAVDAPDTERDFLDGGNGNDRLNGNAGNDTVYGAAGDDTVRGGKNDDLVVGGSGNDRVWGELGDDTLYGVFIDALHPGVGDEIDTLTGGGGADTFVLGVANQRYYDSSIATDDGGNRDYAVITDFSKQLDTIQLAGAASDYHLRATSGNLPFGVGIFFESARPDELIAIVRGPISLDLTASYFTYN